MNVIATVPRHSQIGSSTTICFQRQIREHRSIQDPRPCLENLSGCEVREISSDTAKHVILKYEWLGTMGRSVYCCGLFSPSQELLGVACFGWPGSPESRDICGKNFRDLAICLERGACVHYAPKNAASFLIRRACRIISKNYGYKIFYAYSDEDAGEIGTVYQASNWVYLGQGLGRTPGRLREYYKDPSGKIISSRALRHRGLKKSEILHLGWSVVLQRPKHKYVWFEANPKERKKLFQSLRYAPQPYPKR